ISGGLFSDKRKGEWLRLTSLHEILDRLGIYHDMVAGTPPELPWSRIEAALNKKPIKVMTLLNLLGCDFPSEFILLRCRVVKLSHQKRLELDSRGNPLEALHCDPRLGSYSSVWCLAKTESIDDSVISYASGSFNSSLNE